MSSETYPLVSIVITNYNGSSLLYLSLPSIFKTDYPNFEIIFIDDGSVDKSFDIAKNLLYKANNKGIKRIILLKNKKNMGISYSRNRGIAVARGKYVAFLDNDVEVDPYWLKNIILLMERRPDIGAAQSLLLDFYSREKVQSGGKIVVSYVGWAHFDAKDLQNILSKEEPNIFGLGAALVVRSELAQIIGGFDDMIPLFSEDIDFCWRIYLLGKRVVLVKSSKVYHMSKPFTSTFRKKSSMTKRRFEFFVYNNAIRSMIKNYQISTLSRYIAIASFIFFFRAVYILAFEKDSSSIIGLIRAIINNIRIVRNLLSARRFTQAIRSIPDKMIINNVMFSGSPVYLFKVSLARRKSSKSF
jgi:GT2 family glycosyltransferase